MLTLALTACGSSGGKVGKAGTGRESVPARIHLVSSAFHNGGGIPVKFTCDGENVAPPLRWSGVPKAAVEQALVVADRDAPGGRFVHWLLFGIDSKTRSLEAGSLPAGAQEGKNDFGDIGYGGPCPPRGDRPHKYAFMLYALRSSLALPRGASAEQVRAAIARKAVARGALVGSYGRR